MISKISAEKMWENMKKIEITAKKCKLKIVVNF